MDPNQPTTETPTPETTPETTLANIEQSTVPGLLSAVQKRLADRYADDVLKIIEERGRLERALKRYNDWATRIDGGDISAIKEFRKERNRLENEDDYEL